jgi:RimJ/RimL family protein N-acetyltransferase
MISRILEGPRVKLRPPRQSDIEAKLALGVDPEIMEMFGVSRDVHPIATREQANRWVERLMQHPHAWIIEHGSLIGEVRLDNVDLQDRRASMAIGIFDRSLLGQGLGTEAIGLVSVHAFDMLGLHRIGVRVLAYNERAIRAYRKCGFAIEGRERETAYVNGEWHDDIMMGLLDREFKGATRPSEQER